MKFREIKIILIWFLSFALPGSAYAYYNPGPANGLVNDYAAILTPEQEQRLESKLAQFASNFSNEIAVYILSDLRGDTIENFAEKLFKDWGIGKSDKDNGVLILIAKSDRQMRIEVGYGLEEVLTDAQSGWIISQIMAPAFQDNNFYSGIDAGIDKIIALTKGEYVPNLENNSPKYLNSDWETLIGLGFLIIMWLSAILSRSKSWWLGGVLGGLIGVILGIIKGFFYFGLMAIVILLPLGLWFDYIVSKKYRAGKAAGYIPWWLGGGNFRDGDSSGFGGFGGGDSGGGGSSGEW